MMGLMVASMLMMSDSLPAQAALPDKQPTLICRPVIVGASRSGDVKICRTKAEWRRAEGCSGATRYCPRKKGGMLGQQTAFALSEDSRIVCRILKATGSRLYAQRICLPNREWARMFTDGSEAAQKMQEQSTRARDVAAQ